MLPRDQVLQMCNRTKTAAEIKLEFCTYTVLSENELSELLS